MKRALVLLISAVLLLSACTRATPTPTPEPTPAATSTPEPAPAATPTPTPATPTPVPTPTPTPVPTSYTSGLPSTGAYHPINVQIENDPKARPQTGMSQADIVYECFMETRSVTRFQCVFNDNIPDKVGPVRSVRLYFIDIAQEYKGMLVFWGGPTSTKANVNPKLASAKKSGNILEEISDLDGKYTQGSKYDIFSRDKKRAAPHNGYANPQNVLPLFTEPVEPVSHFRFNADADYSPYEDVTSLEIKYTGSSKNCNALYTYDPDAKNYKRFEGGEPFIDAGNNQQIAVRNVIVQYAKTVDLGTSHHHINILLIGSGNADVYVAGKHIKATWERPTESDVTKFYDENGNEIQLLPGNTWVQEVPDNWRQQTTDAGVVIAGR
jgi:hypothetical protein